MSRDASLSALFATILPGDDFYPCADALPLVARASQYPHFGPAISGALSALPIDFPSLGAHRRAAVLRELEVRAPELVSGVVTAAYSLYYSDETVLKAIAEAENYTPRAPQPEGYALEPFDLSAVALPARQAPSWRHTEQGND